MDRDLDSARDSRRKSLLWVAGFILFALGCVAVTFSPYKSGYADGPRFEAPSDVALYNAEVHRMRTGQGYYQAAAAELRARGYPTASVFNWRTPLPMWLVALLPHPVVKTGLCSLAVLLIFAAAGVTAREAGPGAAVLCAVLMFGAVMPVFLGDLFVMPVLWGGVLIGLSVCAYAAGSWRWGVAAGLAALFCRDLAGAYCLLAAILAIAGRRREEVLAWAAGFTAYGVFFLGHAACVVARLGPDELAHHGSWLQLGGLPFVISTVQLNAYLLVSPQWAAALYFAAAMAGFAAGNTPGGQRIALSACLYVAMLAAIGHSFNQYWGALFAPLLCFGAARFPGLAVEYVKQAAGTKEKQSPPVSFGRG